jgi:hypothetical protein
MIKEVWPEVERLRVKYVVLVEGRNVLRPDWTNIISEARNGTKRDTHQPQHLSCRPRASETRSCYYACGPCLAPPCWGWLWLGGPSIAKKTKTPTGRAGFDPPATRRLCYSAGMRRGAHGTLLL